MPDTPETMQAKYRMLFLRNGTLGLDVLSDILISMCHFGHILEKDNQAQIGQHNVGTMILMRCGIIENDTAEQVIRALANVVPSKPTQEA